MTAAATMRGRTAPRRRGRSRSAGVDGVDDDPRTNGDHGGGDGREGAGDDGGGDDARTNGAAAARGRSRGGGVDGADGSPPIGATPQPGARPWDHRPTAIAPSYRPSAQVEAATALSRPRASGHRRQVVAPAVEPARPPLPPLPTVPLAPAVD
jgi:hypothetical protein